MTDTKETTFTGESLTYEILWSCCKRQLNLAEETESGEMYFLLTSMCMAYFTYESYLNFTLHKVAPEIYEDQRNYFRQDEYMGTPGKLKKLCELAALEFPDTSRRPYQSVKMLQRLRDSVAHGKADTFEVSIKHKTSEYPSTIPSSFEEMVKEPHASRCIEDLEKFVIELNGEIKNKYPNVGLLSHPLRGFLGHSISNTLYE